MVSRVVAIVLGVVTVCVGVIFTSMGLRMAFSQAYRLRTYVKTTATIVESRLERVTLRKSEKAPPREESKPAVVYRFETGGRQVLGTGVDPEQDSGSAEWANSILQRCPPGAVVEVFYDPQDPGRAYLVNRFELTGYELALMAIFILSLWGPLWREGSRRLVERLEPVETRHRVQPTLSVRHEILTHVIVLGVGGLLWAVTVTHYLLTAPGAVPWEHWAVGAALPVVGLLSARSLPRLVGASRAFEEAVVTVGAPVQRAGEEFEVDIAQAVRRDVNVSELSATLSTGHLANARLYPVRVATERLPVGRRMVEGEMLRLRARFRPDPGARATDEGWRRTEVRWWIEVATRTEDGVEWKRLFPIRVEASGA